MKRLYAVAAIATTFLAFSCQKNMGTGSGEPQEPSSAVPADFKWETTRDLDISVGMPSVTGNTPQYAVIRVYCSPILSDGNIVAMGVVTPSRPVFGTAVTIPAGIGNIYVQTTLPDGTVAVSMEPVAASVNVAGARMKAAAGTPLLRMAGMARAAADSSMPDYPRLAAKAEGDFAEGAIIRSTPAGKIDLGASWAPFAAAEYYIPAGAEVTGNIGLNGTFSPNPSPILYVAGKLTLDSSVTIGQATLAVLPGGEVYIREASANMQQNAPNPAIFVFEGGKFTTGKTNFSCKAVVNEGKFIVDGTFDINNSCAFYNGATAELEADDMEITNRAKLYNDGKIESDDLELNSYAELSNCENGVVDVDGTFYLTNNSVVYQKGLASMEKLEARGGGTLYVNCHTVAEEIAAEGARFYIASGAGLDAEEVYFNSNTELYAAAGSIFAMDEYNAGKSGGNVHIVSQAAADQLMAVVVIREKGVSSRYYGTKFDGLMEVVYDNAADSKYVIDERSLTGGAVMRAKQTVVIPEAICNGGRQPVTPDPEPEPEYIEVKGAPYTYCFEDGWPWIGDYDMNDVVVVVSVDRRSDKETGKVELIRINWELKAAGAAHLNAFAVQLDKVRASEVAGVETTNTTFGRGAFAGSGPESGSELAVIPLFNTSQEILGEGTYINTTKGVAIPTVKHTTTVTFAQPVDPAAVRESALNAFIVVNQKSSGTFTREKEIHIPGRKPTQFAVVSGNTFLESDPYRYFVTKGDGVKNNYMMWALRLADFLELGELMARDALNREESCGGHFRTEHQTEEGEAKRDDEHFVYAAVWEYKGEDAAPELTKEPLNFEFVHPAQRNYKD